MAAVFVVPTFPCGAFRRVHQVVTSRRLLVENTQPMLLHVMLTRTGGVPAKGLCGAVVKNLYVSKVPADGTRRPDLCPVCRALALKTKSSDGAAATG